MTERIKIAKQALRFLYAKEGPERCGFIHKDKNNVIEVKNIAPDAEYGFIIAAEAIIENTDEDRSWATWHTHPGATANLSGDDYETFTVWEELVHFIVGSDGVRAYQYDPIKQSVMEI